MNALLYWVVRAVVAVLQALPLRFVARVGRAAGWLWWMADFKHGRLVMTNLGHAFPEKTRAELKAVAKETFLRIAENAVAAVKTASMTRAEIEKVCEVVGLEKLPQRMAGRGGPSNCIAAVGHFGNFELYVTFGARAVGWQGATTYRGMNQPGLDRIVQGMRERSGCLFFERRTEARALKDALSKGGILLGVLADQRPGKGGVIAPFMGRECATTSAPAVLALRYDAPLFTIICYRVAVGRWRMEVGDEIPLRQNGEPRSGAEIMADVNAEFEKGVRRDPANWFWVHDRWKRRKREQATASRDEEEADPAEAPGSPST